MSLELGPNVEHAVRARAAAEGLSVDDLLARTFASQTARARPVTESEEQVRSLLAQWQDRDHTPIPPTPRIRHGETATQALFRHWEEEDAGMTQEEREAEDRLWEDLESEINVTRVGLGLRRRS